jgi:hypothetical protein
MYDLSVLEAGPPAAGTSGTADGPASPAAATERAKPAGDQS